MLQDAGVYKLVASNTHGQVVSSGKILVKEDVTDRDDTIIDNLEFHYRSDNTDNDIFEEEYLHISEDSGGSPVLSGNEYESSKTIHLNTRRQMSPVNEQQIKPKFLKLFESTRIKENSALLLTCQVFGDPMPDIYWHKDSREIRNNNRVNIMQSNNGANQVYISRALMDDAGVYQVTASNAHGIAVYHSEVVIERTIIFLTESD